MSPPLIVMITAKERRAVPTLVFDVRANHDTGVSRYGLSVLAGTAPLLAEASWRLLVFARPVQAERARRTVDPLGFQVVCGRTRTDSCAAHRGYAT